MRKQQIEWSEKRRQRRWLMIYGRTEEGLRRLRRWTFRLSVAFVINAIAIIPFAKGNFLHEYWQIVGAPLLFLCFACLLGTVFTVGMTWVLWSYIRGVRKLDDKCPKAHS